jgi:uncharacterized membrane protein YraQ (UPF0718 family)
MQVPVQIAMAAVLLLYAVSRGGNLWQTGLLAGARSFWQLMPTMIMISVIAGLLEVLLPRDLLSHWLGSGSGLRGIITAGALGAVMPGPPYALYPLVISLYRAGAGIGAVVGFLTGKMLWNLHYVAPAFAILGTEVTLAQLISTALFPPLAGLLAERLVSWFA